MIICVTPDDIEKGRRKGGKHTFMREMFGDREKPWDGPCGHIVVQAPTYEVPAHFHEMDQFQLFVQGSGKVGGIPVRVGTAHYADGYSGYGPIVPEENGLSYLTLRPAFDTSHHLLPENAALAKGRRGRQHTNQVQFGDSAPQGLEQVFQREDGVAVYQQQAAAGQPLADVVTPGGRYWVVMHGEVSVDGKPCPAGSCIWVGQGEATPAMTAGPDGAQVATLCFASHESRQARNPPRAA